MSAHRTRGSFVARIWLEQEADGEPIWRGHVQHVQGDRETYFQDLGEMRDFLEWVSGVPVPESHPKRNEGSRIGAGRKAASEDK